VLAVIEKRRILDFGRRHRPYTGSASPAKWAEWIEPMELAATDGAPGRFGELGNIQRAEFVIADFTGQRQSVYCESGFARSLGRPVIWRCRQDAASDFHFEKTFGTRSVEQL
jgi:hypothetical protein